MRDLKAHLGAQQHLFVKPLLQSQVATEASFHIVNVLVKPKKPFQDGEMVKQAFLEAGNVLFDKLKNKS